MSDTATIETETEDTEVTEVSPTSFLEEIGSDMDDIDLDESTTVDSSEEDADTEEESAASLEGTPEEQQAADETAAKEEPETPASDTPQEPTPQPDEQAQPTPTEQPAQQQVPQSESAAAPSEPQVTAEEVQRNFNEWRGQAEQLLAEQHYALTPEQIEQLQTEPEVIVPRLVSRVYLDAVTAAIGQVTTNLPGLVNQVIQRQQAVREAESAFFDRWPQLREHGETVVRLAGAYRQANPAAATEDFIRDVGAQAMLALQIPIEQSATQPTQTPAAPFKPAATSPAPAAAKTQQRNQFDVLADEFEEDLDLG